MSTAVVTITGETEVPSGPSIQIGPLTLNSSAPINSIQETVLQSGDNDITIPAGTTLVIVQLPAGNAVVTKLVGADSAAASGIGMLSGGGVLLIQPSSACTKIVLNAASLHASATVITII